MLKKQKGEARGQAPAVITETPRKKYRVLQVIHFARGVEGKILWDAVNLTAKPIQGRIDSEVAYYPAGMQIGHTVRSGGHGRPIPTDTSGIIELTDEEARQFKHGQIEPLEPGGVEIPSGFLDIADQEQRLLLQRELEVGGGTADEAARANVERLLEHQRQMQLLTSFSPKGP